MSEQSILDIKVLIGSSQPDLVRELELLLAESFPIQVVGTVPDGRAAIDRAVAYRPDILLIDEGISVVPALDVARQIALAAPGTAAIIVSMRSDAELLQQALVAGARDVLVRPLMLDSLRTSILRAHELEQARTKQLMHFQAESMLTARSSVIAVYSPRGGAGTSTIATNLAVALAHEMPQTRTVLVDLNQQFGTTATLLGVKPDRTILDLAPFMDDLGTSSAIISNVLTPHSSGLRLLAAPQMHLGGFLSADATAAILLALRRAFGFVVVDLPSEINESTLATLERSDRVLHIMTPDVLSVQAARSAFSVFEQRGISPEVVGMVINRTNKRLEIQPREIRMLFPYPVIAEIPADFYGIEGPLSIGQTLAEADGGCAAYTAIRQLALSIVNSRPRPENQEAASVPLQSLAASR
ncbi:MAG TPA: response regulator [Herpetosiphonaceae bacterium]